MEWNIGVLWRCTFLMERLVLLGLAVMLADVVVVFILVSRKFHPALYPEATGSGDQSFRLRRKALLANLGTWIGTLRSIGLTAPYLGVAGTYLGLLDTLSSGFIGSKSSVYLALALREDAALLSTAAGVIVGVPAIGSYNYLRSRLETLQREIPKDADHRSSHFHTAQRLSLSPRFSAIVIAPAATILVVAFGLPWSFGPPVGLAVGVAPQRCESEGEARQIVLHLSQGRKLSINTEQTDWDSLEFRLSQIYRLRAYRTLYLLADDSVPFQDVAYAIDIAEKTRADNRLKASDRLNIHIRLITPKTIASHCPQPILIRPTRPSSRKGALPRRGN